MEIVHIASELAPFAKVGGLADVILGLSQALGEKGHQVEVVLPKYPSLNIDAIENLEIVARDLPVMYDGKWHHNTIWRGNFHKFFVVLVEMHDTFDFFERGGIYGYEDDPERFVY